MADIDYLLQMDSNQILKEMEKLLTAGGSSPGTLTTNRNIVDQSRIINLASLLNLKSSESITKAVKTFNCTSTVLTIVLGIVAALQVGLMCILPYYHFQ